MWREQHQQTVAIFILRSDIHGGRVTRRVRVRYDIYRIAAVPIGGQRLVQCSHGIVGQARQLATGGNQSVRGQYGRAGGVADDGQARSARARLLAQRFGHREERLHAVHAQHAAAQQGRRQHCVVGRVRGIKVSGGARRLHADARLLGLQHDDRLGKRHFARCGQKGPRIAQRFHIDKNAFGVYIAAKIINQVAPAHIHHGAKRYERAESRFHVQAPVQHRRRHRTALADEPYIAFQRDACRVGRVQPAHRIHDAQAVRTNDAYGAGTRPRPHVVLKGVAKLALLGKTRRNDNGALDARLDAFIQHIGHGSRRGNNHGQVHRLGRILDAGQGADAQYARMMRIHRVQ